MANYETAQAFAACERLHKRIALIPTGDLETAIVTEKDYTDGEEFGLDPLFDQGIRQNLPSARMGASGKRGTLEDLRKAMECVHVQSSDLARRKQSPGCGNS